MELGTSVPSVQSSCCVEGCSIDLSGSEAGATRGPDVKAGVSAPGCSGNRGLWGMGKAVCTSRGLVEARGNRAQPWGGRRVLAAPTAQHAARVVVSGGSCSGCSHAALRPSHCLRHL